MTVVNFALYARLSVWVYLGKSCRQFAFKFLRFACFAGLVVIQRGVLWSKAGSLLSDNPCLACGR